MVDIPLWLRQGYCPKGEWILLGESTSGRLVFDCDAPAMILWGFCRGEGHAALTLAIGAPHEEFASWLYCFAHAVGEPSSHRQRRRLAQREDVGRNPQQPMQLALLS